MIFKSLQSKGWERHINLWSLYDVVSATIEINTEWWQSKTKKHRTHLGMVNQEKKEKTNLNWPSRAYLSESNKSWQGGMVSLVVFLFVCFALFSSPTLTDIKIWKNKDFSLSQMEVQYKFSVKCQLHFLAECIK